jgi:hypothetical protein
VEGRPRLQDAEERLRPPRVVVHLRRLRRRRRLSVCLRPGHMLVVEVLVGRRPRLPAAEAQLRSPQVVARVRRRQLSRRLLVRLRWRWKCLLSAAPRRLLPWRGSARRRW